MLDEIYNRRMKTISKQLDVVKQMLDNWDRDLNTFRKVIDLIDRDVEISHDTVRGEKWIIQRLGLVYTDWESN